MSFKERVITQEVSPEFIEHATGMKEQEVEDGLTHIARRLEQTYSVVADVEKRYDAHYRPWVIRVIPSRDADRDAVNQGLQLIVHWLSEYGGETDE